MHVPALVVGVFGHVLWGHYGAATDLGGVHGVHHLFHGAFLNPPAQDGVELYSLNRFNVGVGGTPIVLVRVQADDPAHPVKDGSDGGDYDPAVLGREAVVGLDQACCVAGSPPVQPKLVVGDHGASQDVMDRLVLGQVYRLALAGALSVDIGGQ